MASRRRVTTTTEVLPETPAPEFGEVPVEELDEDVEGVLSELGDAVTKVVLTRRDAKGKMAYLTTMDTAEFSLDEVARRFGGGRYMARIMKRGGGQWPARTFYIDESIRPVAGAREALAGDGAPGGELQGALLERLLDRAFAAPTSAPKDPMEIAAEFAKAQATSQAAMLSAMMPLFERLAGGGKQSTLGELVDAAKLVSDLRGDGGDTSYWPVIKEMGVPLLNALNTYLEAMRRPAAPAAPAPAIAAPAPGAAVPAATPSPLDLVGPWVPKIVQAATENAEPSAVASIVRRMAPKVAAWLDEHVVEPGFAAQFFGRYQELAQPPVAAWVDLLLDEFGPADDEPVPGDAGPLAGE